MKWLVNVSITKCSELNAGEVMQGLTSAILRPVYPQLSLLASLDLTIPFTTADCERVFSTVGNIPACDLGMRPHC